MPRPKTLYTTIPMRDVLLRYREVAPIGMFFSPQNMGTHNTHLAQQAYRSPNGPVFFCTSEAKDDLTPRRYTARRMDWETGEITDVSPFCRYDRSTADNIARTEAGRYYHVPRDVAS